MAENKRITLDWDATGLTAYCIIRREADDFRMDDADGSFAASPADPYISLTEDAVIKGRYELDEARTVWDDGRYSVAIYSQAGGSPAPASDTIIGTGEMAIKTDLEVFLSAPAALASVNTEARLAELDAANLPSDIAALPTVAEIWANATRTLTSFGTLTADLARVLGLVMENLVEEVISRDSNGNKTASTIYIYDSAANAKTNNKTTGLVASYNITAGYTNNLMDLFKSIKAS